MGFLEGERREKKNSSKNAILVTMEMVIIVKINSIEGQSERAQ